MRHAKALTVFAFFAILAGAMVAGIWRVGDAQCAALVHEEVLNGYGYTVKIDPCNEAWAMSVWEPALR